MFEIKRRNKKGTGMNSSFFILLLFHCHYVPTGLTNNVATSEAQIYHMNLPHFNCLKLYLRLIIFFTMFIIAPNHCAEVHHVVGNGAGTEIRVGEAGDLLKFLAII